MIKYSLPRAIEGEELVGFLRESADFLDYAVVTQPLRDTNPNLATIGWKIAGSAFSENFSYNGMPIKRVPENVTSVRITDRGGGYFWEDEDLWTAEAIIDKEERTGSLELELYSGDGIYQGRGMQFIHLARAKPLKSKRKIIQIKPFADMLALGVKERILEGYGVIL